MARRAFACTIICALLGASPVLADEPPASRSVETARLEQQLHWARVERTAGWVLAGIGIAAVASGIVLEASDPPFDEGPRYQFAGIVLIVAGAAVAVTGTVLAVIGNDTIVKTNWRLKPLVSLPLVAPVPGGVVLGWTRAF